MSLQGESQHKSIGPGDSSGPIDLLCLVVVIVLFGISKFCHSQACRLPPYDSNGLNFSGISGVLLLMCGKSRCLKCRDSRQGQVNEISTLLHYYTIYLLCWFKLFEASIVVENEDIDHATLVVSH